MSVEVAIGNRAAQLRITCIAERLAEKLVHRTRHLADLDEAASIAVAFAVGDLDDCAHARNGLDGLPTAAGCACQIGERIRPRRYAGTDRYRTGEQRSVR